MPSSAEILKVLNDRKCGPGCPLCGLNNWIPNEDITAAVPLDSEGYFKLDKGVSITPMVQLMCNNCGYLLFFNPIVMGIHIEVKGGKK